VPQGINTYLCLISCVHLCLFHYVIVITYNHLIIIIIIIIIIIGNIILIILIFSACKSWSVNDQKELGGIVDIEWWCNEVLYVFGIIQIFKFNYC